jgi:hypothetical protein
MAVWLASAANSRAASRFLRVTSKSTLGKQSSVEVTCGRLRNVVCCYAALARAPPSYIRCELRTFTGLRRRSLELGGRRMSTLEDPCPKRERYFPSVS